MREIYLATQNPSKVSSLKRELDRLPGWNLLTVPFDVPEPRGEDVKEIAEAKVRYAQKHITKTGVVAIDAGFYVDCLDGWPGALVNPVINNKKLGISAILKLTKGEVNRSCRFKECLAFLDPDLAVKPIAFSAEIPGVLALEERGIYRAHQHWSRLATIFVPDGYEKTLAEMLEDEYNAWRGERETSAIRLFVDWLSQFKTQRDAW